MNNFFYICTFSLLFIPSMTFALGFDFLSAPGTQSNPIYINGSVQIIETNTDIENRLKSQYGSTVFYNCKSSSCGGDMSDPRNAASCLKMVEFNLESGRCSSSQGGTSINTPQPQVTCPLNASFQNGACQCISGYTASNGVCVAIPTLTSCPEGSMLINNTCIEFSCSDGYIPQGNVCVKQEQNAQNFNSMCTDNYGSFSFWNGDKNASNGPVCECVAGYSFNNTNTSCVKTELGVTPDQQCKTKYGMFSRWNGEKNASGGLICDCIDGYSFNSSSCVKNTAVSATQNQAKTITKPVNTTQQTLDKDTREAILKALADSNPNNSIYTPIVTNTSDNIPASSTKKDGVTFIQRFVKFFKGLFGF